MYPLLKDMFSVLVSSECEVLLVLDLKDAFHSLRLSDIQRNIAECFLSLEVHLICIKGWLWD